MILIKERHAKNMFAGLNTQQVTANGTRLWNKAASIIRNAKTISLARKEIKIYCKTLPI